MVVTSNSDPHESSQVANEIGVGHESRWAKMIPARLDAVAVIKATIIILALGSAYVAFTVFVMFWFLPHDISIDDTFVVPTAIYCFSFFLVFLTNVIGGYLGATFAGRDFLFHAVVTGAVLLAIQGAFYLIPTDDPFTFVNGISLLLTVPLAAVGGVIRSRLQKRGDK
jgi:hypothetical protein